MSYPPIGGLPAGLRRARDEWALPDNAASPAQRPRRDLPAHEHGAQRRRVHDRLRHLQPAASRGLVTV